MPSTRVPAVVNSSRFATRYPAANTITSSFANSPGWIDAGPSFSHSFAPLTSDRLLGRTPGSTSRISPAAPAL